MTSEQDEHPGRHRQDVQRRQAEDRASGVRAASCARSRPGARHLEHQPRRAQLLARRSGTGSNAAPRPRQAGAVQRVEVFDGRPAFGGPDPHMAPRRRWDRRSPARKRRMAADHEPEADPKQLAVAEDHADRGRRRYQCRSSTQPPSSARPRRSPPRCQARAPRTDALDHLALMRAKSPPPASARRAKKSAIAPVLRRRRSPRPCAGSVTRRRMPELAREIDGLADRGGAWTGDCHR